MSRGSAASREHSTSFLTTGHDQAEVGGLSQRVKEIFVLELAGARVTAILGKTAEGSVRFNEVPFLVTWQLVDLNTEQAPSMPREVVIDRLKEALKAFAIDGARYQVANTVVAFKF